jgi:hypothetical protein
VFGQHAGDQPPAIGTLSGLRQVTGYFFSAFITGRSFQIPEETR